MTGKKQRDKERKREAYIHSFHLVRKITTRLLPSTKLQIIACIQWVILIHRRIARNLILENIESTMTCNKSVLSVHVYRQHHFHSQAIHPYTADITQDWGGSLKQFTNLLHSIIRIKSKYHMKTMFCASYLALLFGRKANIPKEIKNYDP